MPSQEKQPKIEDEEYEAGDKKANEFLTEIENVDDAQEINVYETDHGGGGTQKHKITVGEFRKQLQEAQGEPIVNFNDGGIINLDYHDFYSIEVVTPEIKAKEEKEEGELRTIDELTNLGVDPDVFYVGGFDQMGNDARTRKFTPEKIVEFGKIIEGYLHKKK